MHPALLLKEENSKHLLEAVRANNPNDVKKWLMAGGGLMPDAPRAALNDAVLYGHQECFKEVFPHTSVDGMGALYLPIALNARFDDVVDFLLNGSSWDPRDFATYPAALNNLAEGLRNSSMVSQETMARYLTGLDFLNSVYADLLPVLEEVEQLPHWAADPARHAQYSAAVAQLKNPLPPRPKGP